MTSREPDADLVGNGVEVQNSALNAEKNSTQNDEERGEWLQSLLDPSTFSGPLPSINFGDEDRFLIVRMTKKKYETDKAGSVNDGAILDKYSRMLYDRERNKLATVEQMNEILIAAISDGINFVDRRALINMMDKQIVHYARHGDYASVRRLLKEGVSIPDIDVRRLLFLAAKDAQYEIFEIVVRRMFGCWGDINFQKILEEMFITSALEFKTTDILEIMIAIEGHAKYVLNATFDYEVAMCNAIKYERADIIKILGSTPAGAPLLHRAFCMNAEDCDEKPIYRHAIQSACFANSIDLAKMIYPKVERSFCNFPAANDYDLDAVVEAIENNNFKIARYMIANVFFYDSQIEMITKRIHDLNDEEDLAGNLPAFASYLRSYIDSEEYKKKFRRWSLNKR
jgi:hypothetical protein